ncbi:hypothetical protein BKA59DRAFT_517374 [Fusarium tricinctum]|uniref:Uncharacterized protein n=1 Tax=Fusarium tricinctum TaxID=61284 RepID=A0A8K0W5P8_9HYPO|nr:hypothetical protein BKA59DRAFT_517374 [Fusarium tricinctum]
MLLLFSLSAFLWATILVRPSPIAHLTTTPAVPVSGGSVVCTGLVLAIPTVIALGRRLVLVPMDLDSLNLKIVNTGSSDALKYGTNQYTNLAAIQFYEEYEPLIAPNSRNHPNAPYLHSILTVSSDANDGYMIADVKDNPEKRVSNRHASTM